MKTIRKTYKYRIYPTAKQETAFLKQMTCCRKVYNEILRQRKVAYEENGKTLSYYDTLKILPELKEEHPELRDVYSQVLQNVCYRVDSAYQGFFRKIKEKKKGNFKGNPGFPRFKNDHRYTSSLTYPQAGGFKVVEGDNIRLSKIGEIKTVMHRQPKGELKTATISFEGNKNRKWYISLSAVKEYEPGKEVGKVTGVDVGLESFLTLSDGSKVENPRFFTKEEKELTKAQRRLAKEKKYSSEWCRIKERIGKIYRRITNKRHDFAHKVSRSLVDEYQVIAFEELDVKGMMDGNWRSMNRSIGDVAWSKFLSILASKAEEAGRKAIGIDPAYTSQTCSNCGEKVRKSLSERTHQCPSCGLCLDRDHNAARNILALGLQSLG